MKKGNSRRRRFVIDLAGVRSAARLHAALAEKLPLPEHYGRNLDAFHDVLTEFGARWSIVFRNAGTVTKGLRAVCTDAMEETPGLNIVFGDGDENCGKGAKEASNAKVQRRRA